MKISSRSILSLTWRCIVWRQLVYFVERLAFLCYVRPSKADADRRKEKVVATGVTHANDQVSNTIAVSDEGDL